MQWLTLDNEPYTWEASSGKKFVNKPSNLSDYPSIMKLMEEINAKYNVDMNSCLVTYFHDGKSSIRLHQDAEKELDCDSPICVFSIGGTRSIEFLSRFSTATESPLLTVSPVEGDLYLMKPGCQSLFKHRVPRVQKGVVSPRYSLSFRKKIPLQSEPKPELVPSPVKNLIAKFGGGKGHIKFVKSSSKGSDSYKPGSKKTTTVLFGTSITSHLDCAAIGKKGRKFVNISKSGAKLCDISDMVDNFHKTNAVADDVEKVIVSVGQMT